MPLSLILISRASALPDSGSRTHLSYNTTGGGGGRVGESLITVLYKTITRFKNGLGVGLRGGTSTHQNLPKQTIQPIKLDTSAYQIE